MKFIKPSKKQVKTAGLVLAIIALVSAGVTGTLAYQGFIDGVKTQGITEFKANDCKKYSDKNLTWLECDL